MIGYPAVISVQVDKEEDKGIQVNIADCYSNHLTSTVVTLHIM